MVNDTDTPWGIANEREEASVHTAGGILFATPRG